jgi:hypothetical protein
MLALVACGGSDEPIVVDLPPELDGDSTAAITRSFDVDGAREVQVIVPAQIIVEGWADRSAIDSISGDQLAAGRRLLARATRRDR